MKPKPSHAIAVELLKRFAAMHREKPWKPATAWLYVVLVLDGQDRGWFRLRPHKELATLAGLQAATVRKALATLDDRGLLPFGGLVADPRVVRSRAIEEFEILSPDQAEEQGYASVTYAFNQDEQPLLDNLLMTNLGEPVVVVEYLSKTGDRYRELWRHKDQLARWSQKDAVALDMRLRMGDGSKL